MDRDELALILGLPTGAVQVIPSACGGGFGGKLDLSIQPLLAIAAWSSIGRSGASTRGPSRCARRPSATRPGSTAIVRRRRRRPADRRPRPRRLRHRRVRVVGPDGRQPRAGPRQRARTSCPRCAPRPARSTRTGRRRARSAGSACPRRPSPTRRCSTTWPTSSGIDRLEIRLLNALRAGSTTATGQVLAGERRAGGLPRGAAARAGPRCAPRRRAINAARPRPATRSAAASASGRCGTASATRRCPTHRRSGSGSRRDGTVRAVQRRAGDRPGLQHGHAQIAADALGVPVAPIAGHRRHGPDAGCGQDLRLAPDVRVGQCGPARRRGPPPPVLELAEARMP